MPDDFAFVITCGSSSPRISVLPADGGAPVLLGLREMSRPSGRQPSDKNRRATAPGGDTQATGRGGPASTGVERIGRALATRSRAFGDVVGGKESSHERQFAPP